VGQCFAAAGSATGRAPGLRKYLAPAVFRNLLLETRSNLRGTENPVIFEKAQPVALWILFGFCFYLVLVA